MPNRLVVVCTLPMFPVLNFRQQYLQYPPVSFSCMQREQASQN